MKNNPIRKRFLVMTIVCVLVLSLTNTAFAVDENGIAQCEIKLPEKIDSSIDYSSIAETIYGYFDSSYRSLEQLEVKEDIYKYISDTDDTHLFLNAMQYGINWRKELGLGIADTKVELIDVKYAKVLSDGTFDIRAYVKVGYRYLEDKSETMTSIGDMWDIALEKGDGSFRIIALDTDSSDYYYAKELIKSNLEKNAESKSYTKKNAIDDAYDVINSRIGQLKELMNAPIPTSENAEKELIESPAVKSVSISYDNAHAKVYANLKGFDYDTLIFKRMSADCTNFVSQCLWVGYGGDQGNSWYSTSGVAACRQLAYQDFRQIPGSSNWFGRSQISSGVYPSGPWMRVQELYPYITTTSAGPRANRYNNLSLYTSSSVTLDRGYVLQLAHSASNTSYFHSVMVVVGGTTMSNATSIYVGQHSSDNGYRQLAELIASNSAPYVRIIKPITGSFNS